MRNSVIRHNLTLALLTAIILIGTSCSSALMQAKLLSVTIKVVDENDEPITGAIVESSNGEQTTTGADGLAKVKFGGIGLHTIIVMAQDRVPARLSVTMPVDMGKTLTARLGNPVDMSLNINITGGINMNMMGSMMYPFLFQALFSYGGYDLEFAPYEPGQWTEWESGENGDTFMKKAFLKRLDNGQEWWQLVVSNEDDGDLLMEVLFSAGRQSIRRLRQQMGDGEPEEIPVSEGWYAAPMELTPESLEGAVTQRAVSVEVPAGTYSADILEFGSLGAGLIRAWRAEGVPGGLVKSEGVDPDGDISMRNKLTGSGDGAATLLNSY